MVHIGNDWDAILADEWEKEYYQNLRQILRREYATRRVYPPMHDIFNALKYTPFADTRIPTTAQDRLTVCAFRCSRVWCHPPV